MTRLKLLLLFILPVCACSSQKADNELLKDFVDDEIGWTSKFPESFEIMAPEEIDRVEGRGQTAMEETVEEELVLTHKNLLWLRKDAFNSFTSNSQPFDPATDGSYEENQEALGQIIEETYRSQGIQFETKYGSTEIDGLEFSTMETVLYTPDRKKVLMNQIMYDRLINGTASLTLNINYNNDEDRDALLGIIKSSKLSKRN